MIVVMAIITSFNKLILTFYDLLLVLLAKLKLRGRGIYAISIILHHLSLSINV